MAVDLQPVEENPSLSKHPVLQFAAAVSGSLNGDLHIMHSYIPNILHPPPWCGPAGRACHAITPSPCRWRIPIATASLQILAIKYGKLLLHLHVEMGTPHDCLQHLVETVGTDLVAIGASSHKWRRMFIGSTAATILESLDCDILIVGTSDLQPLPTTTQPLGSINDAGAEIPADSRGHRRSCGNEQSHSPCRRARAQHRREHRIVQRHSVGHVAGKRALRGGAVHALRSGAKPAMPSGPRIACAAKNSSSPPTTDRHLCMPPFCARFGFPKRTC